MNGERAQVWLRGVFPDGDRVTDQNTHGVEWTQSPLGGTDLSRRRGTNLELGGRRTWGRLVEKALAKAFPFLLARGSSRRV